MDTSFWNERWINNQIAFHLPTINPNITNFLSEFKLDNHTQIFIPLCGKSLDIAWFASQQYQVLGIECSEKAIKEFFTEQQLIAKKKQIPPFEHYIATNIILLNGDFFDLNKELLKNITLVYDRASLVALTENLRTKYVNLLTKLLPVSTDIFLITLEYNQSIMSGPPFSVTHQNVLQMYQPAYQVELLHENDVLEDYLKFKERGLTSLTERVYKITRTI